MNSLLSGVLLLACSYWLLKRTLRGLAFALPENVVNQPEQEIPSTPVIVPTMAKLPLILDPQRRALAITWMEDQQMNKELYLSMAQSALGREARAKAALIDVMKVQGCSEADIQIVLASVDEG